jgi:hypothetical protein
MKLLIPTNNAIQILKARRREIDDYYFNPKAWKASTENDLREIFPLGSMQWLQVSQINFDTFVTSEKATVLAEGKDTARRLIDSYISFVQQYSEIAEQRQVIREKDYEQKYSELLKQWNDLVPGYNELIKKYDEQLTSTNGLLETIEANETEIERIKSETIQLDNVSFSKLTKAFFNLPILQIVTTFSIITAIIVGIFGLGSVYQKNEDNNQIFDLKTEINKRNIEIENNNKIFSEKNTELNQMKLLVDSLKLNQKK